MTDEELIGYCDIHCETPRALFVGAHINRMIELAGAPPGFVQVPADRFYSVKDPMKELVKLATERRAACRS